MTSPPERDQRLGRGVHRPGLTAYPVCPAAGNFRTGLLLATLSRAAGATVGQGAQAQWIFYAPDGTSIVGHQRQLPLLPRHPNWHVGLSDGNT